MAEEFEKVSDSIEDLGAKVRSISEEMKGLARRLNESVEKQKEAIARFEEGFGGRGAEASGVSSGEVCGWSTTGLKKLVVVVCLGGCFSLLYKKLSW